MKATVMFLPKASSPLSVELPSASTVVPEADFGKTIPLEFHHALTGVRFKMGFECYVQKIIITNIFSTMSVNLAAPGTPSISDKKDYTFVINKKLKIGDFSRYAGKVELQVPSLTNQGETVSCQEAALVLMHNGQELSKQPVTLTETDVAHHYEAQLTDITFTVPELENEEKLVRDLTFLLRRSI